VGGASAIPLGYASGLLVQARDAINVAQSSGFLSSLEVETRGSGTGSISIVDAGFPGLSINRVGGALELMGLSPVGPATFGLITLDGSIVVKSDIANVGALTLNAAHGLDSTADLMIQASGGARSVSAESYDLRAGRDLVIAAGSLSGDNVTVAATGSTGHAFLYAGNDVSVTGAGGFALVSHAASGWTQFVNAGHDLRVVGTTGPTGASAAITSAGHQNLDAGNDLAILAGSGDGAFAKIEAALSQSGGFNNLSVIGGGNNASAQLAAGTYQSFSYVTGAVVVQGGAGSNAFAELVANTSSQTLGSGYYGTDSVLVQGGTGSNAYASVRAGGTQNVQSSGDISVLGNSGTGSSAEIKTTGDQTVGSASTYFNDPTNNILVQAGSSGTARILAGGGQTVDGSGNISVLGGPAAGMTASIETTGGNQSIGTSSPYFYDATDNLLIQGGTGSGSAAWIKASGFQSINVGGTISVLGSSGSGADAELVSTGSGQQIGSTTDAYYNDPTGDILVKAGSGGIARIQAFGSQSIMSGGNLTVEGGTAPNMTASIESTNGSQSIGNTYIFSNDPSGNILVQAGTAAGTSAMIKAATGQTIDAGGTITLTGTLAGASAQIINTAGSQTIGNVNSYYYDQTDSITLTAGSAAGSEARIETTGSQNVSTAGNIVITGGVGDDSGASMDAGTGQSITAFGTLTIVGGSGSTPGGNGSGIGNDVSGSQTVSIGGDITITGGATGSETGIGNFGTGFQSITSSNGSLVVLAPAGTPNVDGVVGIESQAGGQSIQVANGSITVDNAGAVAAYIISAGNQSITAQSMSVSLSSPNSLLGTGPYAFVSATGDQTITLNGDGLTPGTATLSVVNLSSQPTSLAAISADANQIIAMDYNAAGQVKIGDVTALGISAITSSGDHTMVAGSLLIQGGASVDANSFLMAPSGTMLISTLYGPVELKGGTDGGAYIDPILLSVVSNGSVQLLAGTNSTANASISAGTFNLAATTGDLNLVNSTTSSAVASIAADSFSFAGPGNVNLTGGTITVSTGGTIDVVGNCNGCDTNLIGPFSVTAFVPPPTDFAALVAGEILTITDAAGGVFDVYVDEDGNLVLTTRRLNQCY
jgi:hypothetical protein